MRRRTLSICWIIGILLIGIVLAVGNLKVAADESFRHVGGSSEWTCRDCKATLQYEPSYLAEQLRLVREEDDSPEPHRWVFDDKPKPQHLTPWNPFHWLAIHQSGFADRSEIARARQNARADSLIKEFGSSIIFKSRQVDGSIVP